MKRMLSTPLLVSSLLFSLPLQAVTVYECVDSESTASYRDRCPPGTTVADKKEFKGDRKAKEVDIAEIAEKNPITVYSVPDCDACELVTDYLNKRAWPFTEKNVVDDAALQDELKEKSGALTVPVLLVGESVIKGYNKPVLESALANAGYPVEEPK